MLAHLTRKRFVRGNVRTGELVYEATSLRWSGPGARGDELEGPVCVVIDVGGNFVVNSDRQLCLTSGGPYQGYAFTPWQLFQAARWERYGFKVLYDESAEAEDPVAVD